MSEQINCPRCNSQQEFKPKIRRLATLPWKEVYIVCHMCGWDPVLGRTTDEIEALRTRWRALHRVVLYETARHGMPAHTTAQKMGQVTDELANALIRLEQDVKAVNGRR